MIKGWTAENGVYIFKTPWSEVHYTYDEKAVTRKQISGFHFIYKDEAKFKAGTYAYDGFVMKFKMLEDGLSINERQANDIVRFYRKKSLDAIQALADAGKEWAVLYMEYSPKTYR